MTGENRMSRSNYLQQSKAYKGFHYSVLEPSALEYLHKRAFDMFLQVKSIFDRNHIKYMICGGTLLGAIGAGNGHFIPWDDDFDVCIFEEDYDRAIECLTDQENGLSDGMILQCVKTGSNYCLGWMKLEKIMDLGQNRTMRMNKTHHKQKVVRRE